jgi:Iap family predicted aminopeptidase
MTRKLFIAFLYALVGVVSVIAQSVPVSGPVYSTKEAVSESIKAVPCDRDLRLEGVRKLFRAAGATEDDIKIEKFDKDKISNLVVRKKGKTAETVVIGAHYDRTPDGCGVTDNWSGVTIIAHIFGTLRPLATNKSYTFVAFDREEEGLKGSRAMVKNIPDTERVTICSMVNFDSFGQAYPMALKNASSGKLLDLAESLAKQNEMTFNSVTIEGASSDSEAFREKKIPAITMSGLGNNWTEILHSGNDKLEKVNMDSIYLGYRFGLLFISRIDAAACGDFR